MNISFDLDSTLIPYGGEFQTEKVSRLERLFGVEGIRTGTPHLIHYLQSQGHTVHIYTTSFRSKRKIRRTMKYHGITVDQIITQVENQNELKRRNIRSSKFPSAFGFDVHIDDSRGVQIEAERYHFKVIVVDPSDYDWSEKIKIEVQAFRDVP